MKVLVACEESQAVCIAFRELGHEAYSCDIIECSGGHPEWHTQQDVLPLLNGNCDFLTMDGKPHSISGKWDVIIAFPPCTYLTVSGNAYFNEARWGEKAIERKRSREEAANFFMRFANAECEKIAIENPVGVMSTRWRKPDCIVQPYQFGHPYTKQTCLWLKNLPALQPTNILEKPPSGWENQQFTKDGRYGGYGGTFGCNRDGKWLRYGDPEVKKARSKTFPGIAKAMAEQWGGQITAEKQQCPDNISKSNKKGETI